MARGLLLLLVVPLAAADLPTGAVARLGSPALRHGERPLALALDASGGKLVSGGPDGSLKLWDTATGRLLGRYAVKDGFASSVAIADNGSSIAARFGDNYIHLVDAATMKRKRTIAVPNVETIALSRDGRLVAGVAPRQPVQVFETENGLERIAGLAGVAVAFSPNGARIARAETGQTLKVTDAVAGQTTFSCTHLSADGVTSLAWSPDGESLLSADAGATGRVRLWRVGQENPLAEWLASGGQAVFAGERIVGLNDRKATVWSAAGKVERTFGTNVSVLAVSADGKVAATSGSEPRISIWDVATGTLRWTEPDDLGAIRDLAAGPNGTVYVAAERGVEAWKPGAKPRVLIPFATSTHVAIGDGTTAAIAEGKLTIWEKPTSDRPNVRIDLGPGRNPVAMTVSPYDGSVFVGFDDRTVQQFEPKSEKPLRAWAAPSQLTALAPTPDGYYLLGVGRDGFARAWPLSGNPKDAPEQKWSIRVARSFRPAMAVSRDSKTVAVTSVVRLEVFDVKSGTRLFQGDRTWNDGPFQAVAFSPDGRFVAAGMQGSAGGASVWEVATGSFVRRFEGGNGSVTKLLVLPDYRLVSASVDDTVLAWELAPKPAQPPSKVELERAWEKLLDSDGATGLANERILAAGGGDAVQLIDAEIRSIVQSHKNDAQHLKALGHAEFAKREAASKALKDRGVAALAAIVRAKEASEDPEVVQRTEKLIAELIKKGITVPRYGKYGDDLRVHRAVWALEAIGTPEAMKALGTIGSENAPGAIERMKVKR